MSQPTPDVYEQGRGMDAHNEVMREVRSRNDRTYDPTEPTRVWLDEDNTPDGVYDSLTIILNTGGCRWARAGGCTMCGSRSRRRRSRRRSRTSYSRRPGPTGSRRC